MTLRADHRYDFHGLTGPEAEARLRSILDRHQGARGTLIEIVHGGTRAASGVLADVVMRVARADPRVADVRRGFVNEGATWIELNGRTLAAGRGGAAAPSIDPPIRRRKRR